MFETEECSKIADNAIRSLYQMILAIDTKDFGYRIIDLNPELKHICEDADDFAGFCNSLWINVHPEDRDAVIRFTDPDILQGRLKKEVYVSAECRIRHFDKSYFWSEVTVCNAAFEDRAEGDVFLFLIHDIHDRKMLELKKEAEIRGMMLDLKGRYDALFVENMTDQQTGCFNRKGMKYYTDIVLHEAEKSGKSIYVCVADLNGLKYLNDTYGHAAGDEAIAEVSSEMLKAAPEGIKTIRTGGDEFLMMGVMEENSKEPSVMWDRIDRALEAYNASHDNPFDIGVSYGWVITSFSDGMTDLDEYISIADEKMYEMKEKRDAHRR